jgi:putative transposase
VHVPPSLGSYLPAVTSITERGTDYLPAVTSITERGTDYLYRKIVGHEVQEAESAELAALLMRRASLAEGLAGRPLVLHSDSNNVSTSFSTARPATAVVGLPEGLVPRSVPDGLTLTLIDLICCPSPDPSAGREHRTARFHLAAACDPRRA